MKKQIDPNLDNLFDDNLFDEVEKNTNVKQEKSYVPTAQELDAFSSDRQSQNQKNDEPKDETAVSSKSDFDAESTAAFAAAAKSDDAYETVGSIIDSAKKNAASSAASDSFEGYALSESEYHHSSEEHHHHHSDYDESGEHHHHHHSDYDESGEHHHHHHSDGHHSSSQHKHKKKKKKMSIPAKIGISVLAVFLAIAVAIAGVVAYFEINGKNSLVDTDSSSDYQEVIEYNGEKYYYNSDVVAIAFIGVDKRDLGTENGSVGTGGQADADIVLVIDTDKGTAKAIAVPRDTMVDVDLYSESGIFLRSENMQLCLSYAYGDGKETSAQNVTTSISRILYDVPISKYFALDLDGIEPINDAIGGVTVESLYDFPDLGIEKGDSIHLQGDLTETYVRQRDMDTVNASLNRTARQVQYIKAFAAQVVPAITQDFSVLSSLYKTAGEYSTTNLSLSNVSYLASLMLSKGITDFDTITLEGEMKASDKEDYADYVYAEFYPDEDKLMEVVLDAFYVKAES